jgi:hypothetical protein
MNGVAKEYTGSGEDISFIHEALHEAWDSGEATGC